MVEYSWQVMIVLEYNVDIRSVTCIYYSQREYKKSIQHSRIQPVMLLVTPKYFLGYSVQFSRGLVYPISSFRLCYRYGYKIDLKHGHQKLVSKSGWPDKAIIFASKSPVDSPNTNRIHLEETNNVKKYNLFISTGDDCIYANWNQFC
nr:hypothetical protein CFP56_66778 [Quercus suber]